MITQFIVQKRNKTTVKSQLLHIQSIIAKLANRLQRRLLAKQQRAWDFNLEEGIKKLSRHYQI